VAGTIFCGWGAQSNLASKVEGWTPDFATQDNYNQFLAELDMHGINPGTVVIDDKWQQHYGENSVDPQKWPDMGGFVREQHEQDRKVLLWLKFWDPDGLPADECITNAGGAIVAVDPTNPKFITRFTESIRYLLASESLNGDGFKVDFSATNTLRPRNAYSSGCLGVGVDEDNAEIALYNGKSR